MYVKVIRLDIVNGTNPLKDYDLDPKTKDIVGIAVRKPLFSTSDRIVVRIKNENLIENLPVELLYCEFVSVPPDKRFFTLIPKIENINNFKLNVDYKIDVEWTGTIDLLLLMNENENSKNIIKR